jgi:hypothetical protein
MQQFSLYDVTNDEAGALGASAVKASFPTSPPPLGPPIYTSTSSLCQHTLPEPRVLSCPGAAVD